MALPPQVQAALDAAEATLSQMNTPAATAEDIAEAQSQEQTQVEAVAPQPEAPPTPQNPPPAGDWEQRYRVLQGKYDHEVPELHRRVRSLETNLQQAIDRLNEASKAKEQKQEEPRTVADPKDVENFGSDLVEMVNRIATAVVGQAARTFDAKARELSESVAQLQQAVTGATQRVEVTAEQAFFDSLAKLVPDWETINANQKFLDWLAEEDPVYGVPRQNALNAARQQLDARRAAAVFNAFAGPRKPPAPAATDPLDKQVSPKAASSATPVQQDQQVLFTTAQVTKFYDDVAKGRYRGKEQEAMQVEQMINAALAEGRIR